MFMDVMHDAKLFWLGFVMLDLPPDIWLRSPIVFALIIGVASIAAGILLADRVSLGLVPIP